MEDEYEIVEIQGKHGMIHLHVPKKEPTQEEINELYDTVAKVALNIYKDKKKKPANKK
ncbi:hypothetical protein [Pseudogracilibacillus auburnensis]|uniref:hypothetical protein n=1 Tax=Pseudogracilibacillus auburnensis TaxID=1494959 RepID=UPI001A95ADBE|nr:hypothetical protein [Pseudogracilibacillus auburnensis]MBO1003135.1 hypothetical protein [Pseudogracilibacillus auburnensis]